MGILHRAHEKVIRGRTHGKLWTLRGTVVRKPGLPAHTTPRPALYLRHRQSYSAYTTGGRGDLDNLFTCSLIALNVDTGKWPGVLPDLTRHDYDSAQTPVLFDSMFKGRCASW